MPLYYGTIGYIEKEGISMNEELNVKVGDKVLYHFSHYSTNVEKIVNVIRVTTTGRIRIDYCDTQFNKYGNQMGHEAFSGFACLSIPNEEDYKRIKEHSIIQKALSLMKNTKPSYEQAVKIVDILEGKDCDN